MVEQAPQKYEMYCHDLEVMSSNPGQVGFGMCSNSVQVVFELKRTGIQTLHPLNHLRRGVSFQVHLYIKCIIHGLGVEQLGMFYMRRACYAKNMR